MNYYWRSPFLNIRAPCPLSSPKGTVSCPAKGVVVIPALICFLHVETLHLNSPMLCDFRAKTDGAAPPINFPICTPKLGNHNF